MNEKLTNMTSEMQTNNLAVVQAFDIVKEELDYNMVIISIQFT